MGSSFYSRLKIEVECMAYDPRNAMIADLENAIFTVRDVLVMGLDKSAFLREKRDDYGSRKPMLQA